MTTFKPACDLTQAYAREWLEYCPETGIFVWCKSFNRIRVGEVAGGIGPGGYMRITIHGHRIMAHILAWLWMTGEYVHRGIDHENAVRHDNRWANLRRASGSQNNMNQGLRSDNALGVKRVCRKKGKKSRPFAAAITVDRRQRHLGYFDTIEAASAAYREAAIREFGEYARFT